MSASFCLPQKLFIKLPEAECREEIPKEIMLKYTTHRAFPTSLRSFIQVKMKISNEFTSPLSKNVKVQVKDWKVVMLLP